MSENRIPPDRTGFVNPPPINDVSAEERTGTVTPLSARSGLDSTRVMPASPRDASASTVTPAPASASTTVSVDTAAVASTGETEESVGKIRDILFGGQMREYEVRFQNLEVHLQSETRRAQDEMERRFGRLESYIREEFAKLSSRLQHETSERAEATKALEETIGSAEARMSTVMQTLDNGLKQDYQDLRHNLYELGLEQEQKLRDARLELITSMQTHSRQLQNDKLGRDTLASLLDDLASKVRTDNQSG